jgi:outer membrane protein assembly factor BamE (lipoprotein component of BamABCDE complex)
MLKKILPLIVLALIVSCGPRLDNLNSLKPGLTKSEVVGMFGKPDGTDYYDGYLFLAYNICNSKSWTCEKYHFAFDKNDQLVGWKAEQNNTVRSSGMVLSFPVPLGQ